MKKIVLLLMAMSFSIPAAARTDKFNQCVLSLLNASCNTAIDRGAPPLMQSEGVDACFIGRGIARKGSKEKKKFETLIEKQNLERNRDQSAAISKCVATPASLKACTLPLIAATRDYYPVCKEAIESKGKKRHKKKQTVKTNMPQTSKPKVQG